MLRLHQTKAPLTQHLLFWKWLPQTPNTTNRRCILHACSSDPLYFWDIGLGLFSNYGLRPYCQKNSRREFDLMSL